jgi:hypothetical protein
VNRTDPNIEVSGVDAGATTGMIEGPLGTRASRTHDIETLKFGRSRNSDVQEIAFEVAPVVEDPGLYKISITGYDLAGNYYQNAEGNPIPFEIYFILDHQAPQITGATPANNSWTAGPVDQVSVQVEEEGSGIDVENSILRLRQLSSGDTIPGTKLLENGVLTLDLDSALPVTPEANGEYQIEAEIYDYTEHSSSFTSTFNYDTQWPIVTEYYPETGAEAPFGLDYVYAMVSDRENGIGVDYGLSTITVTGPNGTVPGVKGGNENQLIWQFADPLPEDGTADGEYTISVDIVDELGNQKPTPHISTFTYASRSPSHLYTEIMPRDDPFAELGHYSNGDTIVFRTHWQIYAEPVTVRADFSQVDIYYVADEETVIDLGGGIYEIRYGISIGNTKGTTQAINPRIPITVTSGLNTTVYNGFQDVILDNDPPEPPEIETFTTTRDSATFTGTAEDSSTIVVERETDVEDEWNVVGIYKLISGGVTSGYSGSSRSYSRERMATSSSRARGSSKYSNQISSDLVYFEIKVPLIDGTNRFRLSVYDKAGNLSFREEDGQSYATTTAEGEQLQVISIQQTDVFIASPIPQENEDPEVIIRLEGSLITNTNNAIVEIYNVAGDLIRTIDYQTAGFDELADEANGEDNYTLHWDATNDSGDEVNNGLYIFIIKLVQNDGSEEIYKKVGAVLK